MLKSTTLIIREQHFDTKGDDCGSWDLRDLRDFRDAGI